MRIKIKVLCWILMLTYSSPLRTMSTYKEETGRCLSRLQENTTARVQHKTNLQINWKNSHVSASLTYVQRALSWDAAERSSILTYSLFRVYVHNTVHVSFSIHISSLFVFLVAVFYLSHILDSFFCDHLCVFIPPISHVLSFFSPV